MQIQKKKINYEIFICIKGKCWHELIFGTVLSFIAAYLKKTTHDIFDKYLSVFRMESSSLIEDLGS